MVYQRRRVAVCEDGRAAASVTAAATAAATAVASRALLADGIVVAAARAVVVVIQTVLLLLLLMVEMELGGLVPWQWRFDGGSELLLVLLKLLTVVLLQMGMLL